MKTHKITGLLIDKHNAFIDYINSLSEEEFSYRHQQKMTAGEQFEHIVLCVEGLLTVYGMRPERIAQTFGKTDRTGRSYDVMLSAYLEKLKEGGKAPERYIPENTSFRKKDKLCDQLTMMTEALCSSIKYLSDEELDSLLIPHPLLGKLTLKEMLFNAIYHVEHHHDQAKQNLSAK